MDAEITGKNCQITVESTWKDPELDPEMHLEFKQGNNTQTLTLTGRNEWADMLDAIEGFGIFHVDRYDVRHVFDLEDGDTTGLHVTGGLLKPPAELDRPRTYLFDVADLMEALEDAISEYDVAANPNCPRNPFDV